MATTTRSVPSTDVRHAAFPARALERARHLFLHDPPVAEEVVLGTDDVRSVHVGQEPMEFAVLDGIVLVTCEGDAHDHVVSAGECYRTDRAGHHVIAALRPSRVWVS